MYRELDPHVGTEEAEMKDAAHRFAADVLRPTGAALDRVADPAEVAGERSRLWPALRQAFQFEAAGGWVSDSVKAAIVTAPPSRA
jgi:hypothetical protein